MIRLEFLVGFESLQRALEFFQISHCLLHGDFWTGFQDHSHHLGHALNFFERRGMLIQFLHIGPGPSPAFRGSGSLAADANGVGAFRVWLQHGFQAKVGFPPGGEVVDVTESFSRPQAKCGQSHALRVIGEVHAPVVAAAIVLTMNTKPMNVFIGPVKGDLQYRVKIGQAGFAMKQTSPPDQWAEVTQDNAELIDGHAQSLHNGIPLKQAGAHF